jgi:hypothetical protein
MSGSKSSRHIASIVNRPTCGGDKKAGLSPSIGWFLSSNVQSRRAVNTMFGLKCIPSTTIQTQRYGYRATFH